MSTAAVPLSPCPRRRASDRATDRDRSAVAAAVASAPLLTAVFDEIDTGLFVCDDEGRVVALNWNARLEASAGKLLQLVDDRLQARSDDGAFAKALLAACRRGRREIVELRQHDDRLFVSVSPLKYPGGEPRALVLLGRRVPCSALVLEMLGYRHGLTAAERRVLAGLAAQRTPAQIASDHAIAISTVRTQINALRAKLDASSVSALMCVVAGIPPLNPTLKLGHDTGATALAGWVPGRAEPVQAQAA
jgi:DNA-binding CsgD family transcriptional regulator